MESKTLISLARMTCGTAILIASMVTGINGTFQMLGVLLLGLPIEALQKDGSHTS